MEIEDYMINNIGFLKLKPFYNINELSSISDTIPFIDYFQGFVEEVNVSWIKSLSHAERLFEFVIDGKKQNYKIKKDKVKKKWIEFDVNNGLIRYQFLGFRFRACKKCYISKDDIDLSNRKYNPMYDNYNPDCNLCDSIRSTSMNRVQLKIFIGGKGIPFGNLNSQLKYIEKLICCIGLKKKVTLNKSTKNTLLNDSMDITKVKVSRLDLAINILDTYEDNDIDARVYDIDLGSLDFYGRAKPRYYNESGIPNFITGVGLGKGGNDSIQFKIYKKMYEDNLASDFKKFNDDFRIYSSLRYEYKIGRKPLSKMKLSVLKQIDVLSDLSPHHIYLMWLYCIKQKEPRISALFRSDLPRNITYNKKKIDIENVRKYHMIKGIIQKYGKILSDIEKECFDYLLMKYKGTQTKIKDIEEDLIEKDYKMIKGISNNYDWNEEFSELSTSIDNYFKSLGLNSRIIEDTKQFIYN